jgi:hypothetical protein
MYEKMRGWVPVPFSSTRLSLIALVWFLLGSFKMKIIRALVLLYQYAYY